VLIPRGDPSASAGLYSLKLTPGLDYGVLRVDVSLDGESCAVRRGCNAATPRLQRCDAAAATLRRRGYNAATPRLQRCDTTAAISPDECAGQSCRWLWLQHGMAWHGVAWHGVAWHGMTANGCRAP
jgi:hypothetical protein